MEEFNKKKQKDKVKNKKNKRQVGYFFSMLTFIFFDIKDNLFKPFRVVYLGW